MGCNASSSKQLQDKVVSESDRAKDKKVAKEENKEYQQTMQFLSQVALFKRLPKDQHPLLAAHCIPVVFKAKEIVIWQGTNGFEFFVIKSGEASIQITKDGEQSQVATLKSGDYFGENALLHDEPRSATIIAETKLSAFKITREKFQELGLHEKLQFANRKAVGAGNRRQVMNKPPSPKTQEECNLIAQALRANPNLQTMVNLDDASIKQLVEVAWKEHVQAEEQIIIEGDLQADYFYIVQEGRFEVFVHEDTDEVGAAQSVENVLTQTESKPLNTVDKGGSFGELALLYLVPRAATVRAMRASTVWVIDRTNFKNILMRVSDDKVGEYVGYVDMVESLSPLLADEKKAVAQALVEMYFSVGEVILQQGESGSSFYILYEGEVSITRDGKEESRLSASQADRTVRVFGERALLHNEPRAATVTVRSPVAKALALDRDSFDLLLGPLAEIMKMSQHGKRTASVVGSKSLTMQRGSGVRQVQGKVLRKDLVRLGLLGCGGFGTVELWEHRVTGNTYAMKGLSKGFVVKTGMQEGVMNEKNILLMTNSPFIIKLHDTYNGVQTLYFLLEPALGGELYATYKRRGLHGSPRHAKYYVAGVVHAFEHCHVRHIIYRDLKPENLLLTETGHLKLTDMGLAKFVIGKTFTTCGTPDYFAPEIIASTGHTKAVDWWTLGVLCFELLSGDPPFVSAHPMQIYGKVMKGISKIPFPAQCQGDAEVLIKGLMKREPSERPPVRPGGTQNIKSAKWFSDFDWKAMEELTLDPPFKPLVKSKKDMANFSARKEDMPRQLDYKDDGSGWDKDFAS